MIIEADQIDIGKVCAVTGSNVKAKAKALYP
jgi:hypothetical protein